MATIDDKMTPIMLDLVKIARKYSGRLLQRDILFAREVADTDDAYRVLEQEALERHNKRLAEIALALPR